MMFTPRQTHSAASAGPSTSHATPVIRDGHLRATVRATSALPLGMAVRNALPSAEAWSRFAHSASVTGVMVGIAVGLWAAPTLAHWQADTTLRSATLTTSAPASAARATEYHTNHATARWMHVADHDASAASPSQAAHNAPPTAGPDRTFAIPRGDLRKDISDANRAAGPRTTFSGH
ncbi:hypothetical protein [Robbsia andropogonis]|nr:hypothetical protein [Robbsia andropogonis]